MRASFQFRAVPGKPRKALFKLSRGADHWEREIPLPYPPGDPFWDSSVDEVEPEVELLARKYDAPVWAF